MSGKTKKVLVTAASVIFWILVWLLASLAAGNSLILPGPGETVKRFIELAGSVPFWKTVGLSCLRITGGLAAGFIVGMPLAMLAYAFKPASSLITPLITVIRAVPVASFIILALLWVGMDLIPSFISFLMVFPIVFTSVLTGLREIPDKHLKLIPLFGLSPGKALRLIYFPSVKPYFLSALRTSFGFSWKAGIAAEVLAFTPNSIGRHLSESRNYLETTDLFAWTFTVIIISLLLESLISLSSRKKSKHVRNSNDSETSEEASA